MSDSKKPKNPWGQAPQNNNQPNKPSRNPSADMPDLDILFKKMKDNFGGGNGSINADGKKTIIIGILVLVALWLASGLYRVEPSENAVVQKFGDYSRTQTDPGMGYHIPWPVESVTKINVTEDRRVTIGFGDALGRSSQMRSDVTEESLMLTSDANIVDIDVVVLWNISDAQDFLFNIKDQDATVKRVAESTIREVVGQTKLQPIITTGREDVSIRARELTQETLDSYGAGIAIKQILIQDATVHPNVMEAFDDVVAAGQDAERFQNEANIYKNDILPKARGEAIKMMQEAQGYKESRIARATGEADRFEKLYSSYLSGKDVTRERIFIETMEDVFKGNDKIIIDQEQGGQGVLPYLPLNKSGGAK
jgi:membrane protease subunit HflK